VDQCNSDSAIGLLEPNVVNWSFISNTSGIPLYGTSNGQTPPGASGTTQIVRCAVGISAMTTGTMYEVFITVTGGGAGTGSDRFISNTAETCP
jgi:hypothetical protein